MNGGENMEFSLLIKEIRKQCYLSQQDFADEIGVSFTTVNRWEKSKALPNYQTMKRLVEYCKRCNVKYEELENCWKEKKQ